MIDDNAGVGTPIDDDSIHAFVDGVSDGSVKKQIMAAMAVDDRLEKRVESYRRQNNALMLLKRTITPVRSKAHDELIDAIGARMKKRRWSNSGALRVAAAVAVIVSAASGWFTSLDAEHRALIGDPFRLASERSAANEPYYYIFGDELVLSNVATNSDQEEISFGWWQSHRIASLLELPNLQPLGLDLVSGRAINSSEAQSIRLHYVNEMGLPVNLLIGESEQGRVEAFTVLPEGQFSLHWRDDNLVFALVGSAHNLNFLKVAELVSSSIIKARSATLPHSEEVLLPVIKPTGPSDSDGSTNVIEQVPLQVETGNEPEPL